MPATWDAKAIHSLRADSLRRWASNVVPTGSSAIAPASTAARAALAMTVRTPDHDAIRAASSFDAMPPLPRPLPPLPARIASSGSSLRTRLTSWASAATRGSAVYSPSRSVSSTSTPAAMLWLTRAAMRSLSP